MSTAQDPHDNLAWDLADRLRKTLRVSGVAVAEMATELDVSRNTVSNYLNGHTIPNRSTLRVWAIRVGLPLDWILTGQTPGGGPDTPGDQGKPPTIWYTETPADNVVKLGTYSTAKAA